MNLGTDLVSKLDRVPPWLCRLMARGPDGLLMTSAELCRRTGWRKQKLRRIAEAKSFRDFKAGEIDTFITACGLCWSRQRKLLYLISLAVQRGGIQTMQHFRHKPGVSWQASMIIRHQRRIQKLFATNGSRTESNSSSAE